MTRLRAGSRELPAFILQKTRSTLCSLTTRNRTGAAEPERKGGKGRIGGVYGFSYIDDSNIPPASESPHWGKSSTGNSLVWNSDMYLHAQNRVQVRWWYTQHINTAATGRSRYNDRSPRVQTQLRSGCRSGGGVGSLSRPSYRVPFSAWYQSQH